MRIGFAIPHAGHGGAELVLRRWVGELMSRGHQVYLLTYDPAGAQWRLPTGLTAEHFPRRSRASRLFLLPFWLRSRAGRAELDVLVSMLTFTNLAALAGMRTISRSRVPLVISERSVLTLATAYSGGSGWPKKWLARRAYPHADAVIAISHAVAADLIGGYRVSPEKTFVVPNPTLLDEKRDSTDAKPAALHVVFVGRLVPQKRPEVFLEALDELAARGIRIRGSVIGEGPLRPDMERQASNGSVPIAFLGWSAPWWESVPDADCLLVSSAAEGFANVLVEAAAVGIRCVAPSQALGVSDAIVPGLTGEFAVGLGAGDLADAVVKAVNGASSEACRSRWLQRFSVRESTATLLSVLMRFGLEDGRFLS